MIGTGSRTLASAIFTVLAAVWAVVPSGCASGPGVSGFAIGPTRIVSVGELVTVRIPVDERGDREWRVTSFDSLYLVLVEGPHAVVDGGRAYIETTARARVPGTTEIVFQAVRPSGTGTPSTKTLRVRILDS